MKPIRIILPTVIKGQTFEIRHSPRKDEAKIIKVENVSQGRKTVRAHETVKFKYTKQGWTGTTAI